MQANILRTIVNASCDKQLSRPISNYRIGIMIRSGMHRCGSLFNGRQAIGGTKICKRGVIGVKVKDTICIGGYCFPNTSKQDFARYMEKLEAAIREGKRRAQEMMVAGDFNSKFTV